ncbi:hypothetical protein MMC19_004968 [Ptychographa xylographoides]|nr:hypothetical protein [Ptychographa xylographoides]
MEDDPFDSLLGLEDQFYDEGYQLGVTDGTRAGHVEGRLFGLEKGFEKYVAMGKLHGRSVVWANRLPNLQRRYSTPLQSEDAQKSENADVAMSRADDVQAVERQDNLRMSNWTLPQLPESVRLEKHIRTFHALVELESLSTQNKEDDVSEFDDRLKRATAKARIIEKLIGEESGINIIEPGKDVQGFTFSQNSGDGSIEDVSVLGARH